MGRYVDKRVSNVRMPSEIPDGRDSGARAGPVITYRLSDEELARYRGEEMMARIRRFEGRLPELFARFSAGEADTPAGKTKLAREFEVTIQTIYYHYNRWKASQDGREGQQSETQETSPGPVSALEAASPVETESADTLSAAGPVPEPTPVPGSVLTPPAEGGGSATGYARDESRKERVQPKSESPAPKPRPVWPPNLCETCVKRDVCLVAGEVYLPPQEYNTGHLPPKLRELRITVSARYVQECSAYRADAG